MERIREAARADVQDRTRMLVQAGALAALGCAATMVLRIPSPTGGYLNLGDAVVLLGAYLLGPAWGALAGGIGPALADLLAGYAAYVPATLVIKVGGSGIPVGTGAGRDLDSGVRRDRGDGDGGRLCPV